jgi:hypothetical protein
VTFVSVDVEEAVEGVGDCVDGTPPVFAHATPAASAIDNVLA